MQVFGNYTYTNPEFDHSIFDGKTIPLTPESKWTAGFALEILKHLKFSAQAVGVYDQFALNDFNNIAPANDYWTLGGKIAYAPGPWEIYVKAQNVLDEEYSSFVGFSSFGPTVTLNPAPTSYWEGGFKIEI